ncbi:T9SS type A sorting domain-containing protein [Flavobacterium sp. F372]|uniref:T9SS type A sorting domain-containing protein n=1 Tax=Flavobacterium bernardetii TaxID=2813823 RepID=A0ABR7IWN9_9FLAO|nr:choice-of-anchor Q domain-containing protein [Flavobacterium bernardetii]MBC5834204.1 T9SS type A sorting domain-containing protein [Flavobacterium bernardetii]NHF70156.1 T9SS type A sorting domain-containing protein [Flavobacterium bernardetii]
MRTKLLFLTLILSSFFAKGQTIYVNQNATGSNNGTSWANAFVSLQTALTSVTTTNKTIWVAAGTYKPSPSNRETSFTFNYSGTSIYGGFIGTETLLSQRNSNANITTLNGDLLSNDNSSLLPAETTRQDNSYHVVQMRGNIQNIIIDGFTISGGNANGVANNLCTTSANLQSYHLRGGAIYANPYAGGHNLTAFVRNCILEKNSGTDVAVYSAFHPCGITVLSDDVNFEQCTIKNNYSGGNSAMLFSGSNGYNTYSRGAIINCLFYNNTAVNASCIYLGASTASGGNATGIDVDIINSTFSNNIGANGNVITMTNASNSRVRNCIIYGNGSTTPLIISNGASVVNNCIFEGGQASTTNLNPQFTDASTNNYTLSSNSPAINIGNNTYTTAIVDLAGNSRVFDTTIDLGAYEFSGCTAPTNIVTSLVTGTSATVTWNNIAGVTYNLVYVITGQPIASGTEITNIATNTYNLTNLDPSTKYDIYISKNCTASINSGWTVATSFRTLGPIYVNQAATGNGSGSSWTNAYTTLDEALLGITTSITEIRVAQGTYKPKTIGLANPRKATFTIPPGAQIYGGFNGTETTLSERNPLLNITTLNGDLIGDDNTTIVHTNAARNDNAYHVISLFGNNTPILIDGFTISGGNANGSLDYTLGANSFDDTRAGAIYVSTKNASNVYCDVKNCILEKNTGSDVGVYATVSVLSANSLTVNFDKCIVRNNQSSGGFSNLFFYSFSNSTNTRTAYSTISNCLFHNNVSNYAGGGQGSSCITNYQDATAGGNFSTLSVLITNCTFTNNTGPNGKVLSLLNASNTRVANSIIYGNGSTTPIYLNSTVNNVPTGNNNIIQGGQLSGLNSNPLFVSTTNFQLSTGSPAINSGNNSYVNGTKDLLGNARIHNTTVDMGAYEYDMALNSVSFQTENNFKIYPNPTSYILNISITDEIKGIEIYSLEGKLVISSTEKIIDVSRLQSGFYILKVINQENNLSTKKFQKI